jgi:uncharacterized membrane-anchored protein
MNKLFLIILETVVTMTIPGSVNLTILQSVTVTILGSVVPIIPKFAVF